MLALLAGQLHQRDRAAEAVSEKNLPTIDKADRAPKADQFTKGTQQDPWQRNHDHLMSALRAIADRHRTRAAQESVAATEESTSKSSTSAPSTTISATATASAVSDPTASVVTPAPDTAPAATTDTTDTTDTTVSAPAPQTDATAPSTSTTTTTSTTSTTSSSSGAAGHTTAQGWLKKIGL
jgi:hypothetical protein